MDLADSQCRRSPVCKLLRFCSINDYAAGMDSARPRRMYRTRRACGVNHNYLKLNSINVADQKTAIDRSGQENSIKFHSTYFSGSKLIYQKKRFCILHILHLTYRCKRIRSAHIKTNQKTIHGHFVSFNLCYSHDSIIIIIIIITAIT